MHAGKAAVSLHDGYPSSHRALLRLFGLELVKRGLVEDTWSAIISQSSSQRIIADYDVSMTFSQADAVQAYTRAQSFLDRMRLLLGNAVPPGTSEAVGEVH